MTARYSKRPVDPSEDESPKVQTKPHPLMKVPGIGSRAVWDKKLGRWVVPVIGGTISDERQG